MIDPYRMIVVNAIASLALLAVIFLYKKIFPKKRVNHFFLLILISILPVISIFRKGIYESGDFIFHIYHTMDFSDALREGVLIPSWSAGLNSGFGHPVFTFIYIVPYYLMSFVHFLGATFIMSERIVLAGAFIGPGITMWMLLKKLTKNDLAAFSGSILYLFAPYHLVDIHFRVAIAETIAFAITPVILYVILLAKEQFKLIHFAWISLLFGILFLNHPAMFVVYSGLFTLYVFFLFLNKRVNLRFVIYYLISFIVGLLICSFGWLSRVFLTPLTEGSQLVNIPVSFVKLQDLLFSPWRLGFLFQGPYGELSYVIGYGGLFIILLSMYSILKKITKDIDVYFWLFICVAAIFIMLPISKPLWDTFKFLNLMQFSYRFLHPMAFSVAILTALMTLIFLKRKNLIYLFLALCIGYTILNWGNRGTIPHIDDNWIRNNLPNGTKEGEKMIEATPLWWNTKKDFLKPAKSNLELVSGSVNIQEFERKTTKHTYGVRAYEPSVLVENTLYFPDWKIYVNGNEVPIEYRNPKYNARMVFNVPEGLHYIEARYEDIKHIKYAKRISAAIFLSLCIYIILYYTSWIFEFIKKRIWNKRK